MKVKGLLIKDFSIFMQQIKILALIVLIWAVMLIQQGSVQMLSAMLCFVLAVSTINTMSYDEAAQCESYLLTMPYSRKHLIQGKYLFGFLLTLAGAALSLIFCLIAGLMGVQDFWETASSIPVMMGVGLILISLILPITYKFGVQKSRFIYMLFGVIPSILILLLRPVLQDIAMPEFLTSLLKNPPLAFVCFAAFVLLFLWGSYRLSLHFYEKREF